MREGFNNLPGAIVGQVLAARWWGAASVRRAGRSAIRAPRSSGVVELRQLRARAW